MFHPNPVHRRAHAAALLSVLLAALLVLAGCGGSATGNDDAVGDDGEVDLSKVTLIVGDQKGGSKALLTAAGELDDVPYEIEWKEFTSGPPLLEALNSGAIHVGGVGNTPPIFAAAGNSEFKAVQAATYGGAGDAIVVPPGSPVKSVADLKGKTVAVAEGSSANYNLLAQLDKAGLKYSDVKVQDLQPADALAAFTAGHVDAWAVWEPFTSQAETDAQGQEIANGEGLVNGYVFQVASDEALADPGTEEALADYLARIARAQNWSGTHQEDWSTVWATETGLAPEITLAAVGKRKVQVVSIDDELIASEQGMADAFTDNGLLPEEIDLADFFSDQYNDAVAEAGTS
jgi:sulfonate transport system substrate-binding protein